MVKSTSNQPQQGANTDEAPTLLRDLAKILESNFGIDAAAVNSQTAIAGALTMGQFWGRNGHRYLEADQNYN